MIANAKSVETDFLVQLKAGNEDAFEELVAQCTAPMLRLAKTILNNDDDAEDAVQDAFLSVFKSMHRFSGSCATKTWLHRIVVNACLMKLRSQKRRPTVSIEDLLPHGDESSPRVEPVASNDDSPLATIINREACGQVRACIDRLPEEFRSVLILRDIDGVDTSHAAMSLDTTNGAIRTRLHRARHALRTLLVHYQRNGTKDPSDQIT